MPKESEPLGTEQASQRALTRRRTWDWEQGPWQVRAGASPADQPCLLGPKVQLSPRGCRPSPKTMFKQHDPRNHTC